MKMVIAYIRHEAFEPIRTELLECDDNVHWSRVIGPREETGDPGFPPLEIGVARASRASSDT